MRIYKTIKEDQRSEINSYTNDLHEALLENQETNFFGNLGDRSLALSLTHHISGLTDDYEITSTFADHFANLCSTSNSNGCYELLEEYTAARKDYVGFPLTDSMLANV